QRQFSHNEWVHRDLVIEESSLQFLVGRAEVINPDACVCENHSCSPSGVEYLENSGRCPPVQPVSAHSRARSALARPREPGLFSPLLLSTPGLCSPSHRRAQASFSWHPPDFSL